MTTDRAKLECLAQVPAGTYDKLDVLKLSEPKREQFASYAEYDEAQYQFYLKMQKHEDEAILESFLLNGYGRRKGGPGSIGRSTNPVVVAFEAASNLVPRHLIPILVEDGVCWS